MTTTSQPQTAARPSLFSAVRVRDFRLLWLGESISLLGDQFYLIALPWLTLQLTGSGLALGAVAAAGGIPRALFMLLGGAFTDRFSPRNVMLVSNLLRVLLAALVTLLIFTNTIQLWMLFVMALAFGTVDAFFFPAQAAMVPQLVERDQIESGNALTQITAQFASFVGPALAGLVIAAITGSTLPTTDALPAAHNVNSVAPAFAIDTLTFIIAALALWFIKHRAPTLASSDSTAPNDLFASIAQGLRIVWNDSLLRTLVIITAGTNLLFTGPIGVGIPVLTSTRFPEGAAAMGAILSAFGGGALVGALLGGSLPTPRHIGIVAMSLIATAAVALTLFGLLTSLPPIIIAAAAMGLCVGYTNVIIISWLQKQIAPEMLGRVMSLVMLGSVGLGPLSNLLAGVLVEVNLSLLFIGAGGILMLLCLVSLSSPRVRTMTA